MGGVRLLTVVGVIVVHSTSITDPAGSDATGGVLVVLHVTREVFLFLSAFVLAFSSRDRPLDTAAFWRRRYPLVVVPYVAWSVIYVLTGGHLGSPGHALMTILGDLPDAGAHFQLYFLLLTFQLYLVFPTLLRLLARRPRLHVPLLAAAFVFQLAFSAAVQYGWRPPFLGEWLRHPGSWLPSYELYVIAGLLAALHFERLTDWVRRHSRLIAVAFFASVSLGVANYIVDLTVLGYGPLQASAVFQPVVVVEAAGAVLAQYAVGLWVADRCGRWRRAQLRGASDVSFGVYLAHPLVVVAILDLAGALGGRSLIAHLSSGWVEALVVVGLVPAVYVCSFGLVRGARRTRLSLALSGRPAVPGVRSGRAVPPSETTSSTVASNLASTMPSGRPEAATSP